MWYNFSQLKYGYQKQNHVVSNFTYQNEKLFKTKFRSLFKIWIQNYTVNAFSLTMPYSKPLNSYKYALV